MQKLQVRLWSALFQKEKMGGRFVLEPKTKKRRILESCHAGIERYNLFSTIIVYRYVYTCRKQLSQR